MPESIGADARQSRRTLQMLDTRLTDSSRYALAAVGWVLCAAINQALLVVNPDLSPKNAESADALLDALYAVQDALNGSHDDLPDALLFFVDVAESGVCRG